MPELSPLQWPPTLDQLKIEMDVQNVSMESRDDQRLSWKLDASIAFVQRRHEGRYDFDGDALSELPAPDYDMIVGTMRMAWRWHTRGRSPDGLIDSGDLGTNRVPSVDYDIARMLRIGPFSPMEFA